MAAKHGLAPGADLDGSLMCAPCSCIASARCRSLPWFCVFISPHSPTRLPPERTDALILHPNASSHFRRELLHRAAWPLAEHMHSSSLGTRTASPLSREVH